MQLEEFRQQAHKMVDWMVDYLQNIEQYPVKSQVRPKEIYEQLPDKAPQEAEHFDTIFKDFLNIILPGMTHWQSPNFFAYFPGNSSYASLLAEMLMSVMGAQCMIWETSPAATELEEKVLNWIRDEMQFPSQWQGVIQDTASTATLCAILSARERKLNFESNQKGLDTNTHRLRVYASEETHSSIEKAVKIAGLGKENFVKVAISHDGSMNIQLLEQAILADIEKGYIPTCIVATIGTTGMGAWDDLQGIVQLAKQHNIWLHVDAAYAGTALLLEEYRALLQGWEQVDSFVFNPHKWMFTNFDCSIYYVKEVDTLLSTLSILPEYLKTTTQGQVNNYKDWGIPLGRRFRALRLWFVLRNLGMDGIRKKLRHHIDWAEQIAAKIRSHKDFELMAPRKLNHICFRYHPPHIDDEAQLEQLNIQLMEQLNNGGKVYFTHTRIHGVYVIRWVMGQTYLTWEHLEKAWALVQEETKKVG